MDTDEIKLYKEQLNQVNEALHVSPEGPQRDELLALKNSIQELLSLTNGESVEPSTSSNEEIDEFALFMAEMEKDGALLRKNESQNENKKKQIEKLGNIEGMKCRAPHEHQWGNIAYHNAMVCSIVPDPEDEEIKVRVLFTNPTHQEMLPCPYYYESDCKFSDEKCRYSHGEVVLHSTLQEYVEPKFESLCIGSRVLAKQPNNLWDRAIVRQLYDDKCLVRFECNKKDVELTLENILPLDNDEIGRSSDEDEIYNEEKEDIINMSLMITPSNEKLGSWEKFTKGMGSKLMQKMGYVVGTGLGKNAEGRIDPVTAVILPAGKSLDHCMKLREQAGGDQNLFSVERKLKRLQKKQELQNQKAYERKLKNEDVFNFINSTLSEGPNLDEVKTRSEERQKIKQECCRSLNIKSLQIADNIRKAERDLDKLRDSLSRHTDVTSNIHLKIKDKLVYRQDQLKMYQTQAQMIRNEQNLRSDKKENDYILS